MSNLDNNSLAFLRAHLRGCLIAALPELQKPRYYGRLLEQLVDKMISMLSSYGPISGNDIEFVERAYPEFEREFLVFFLDMLPNVSGSLTAKEKDLLDSLIRHSLAAANEDLTESQENYAARSFEEIMKVYAGLVKVDPDFADKIYELRVNSMLKSLKAKVEQGEDRASYDSLRNRLSEAIDAAAPRLKTYQAQSLIDQFLYLFQDYFSAEPGEREELYKTAEIRMLISAFDPTGFPTSMGYAGRS